MIGDHASVLYA